MSGDLNYIIILSIEKQMLTKLKYKILISFQKKILTSNFVLQKV